MQRLDPRVIAVGSSGRPLDIRGSCSKRRPTGVSSGRIAAGRAAGMKSGGALLIRKNVGLIRFF